MPEDGVETLEFSAIIEAIRRDIENAHYLRHPHIDEFATDVQCFVGIKYVILHPLYDFKNFHTI